MKDFLRGCVFLGLLAGLNMVAADLIKQGGDLTVKNTTSGMLRAVVKRGGVRVFDSESINSGTTLKKHNILAVGDVIDFVPAGDTYGPMILEPYTVGSLYGRPENVVIDCKSERCDRNEN